jgi:hypothetical protein
MRDFITDFGIELEFTAALTFGFMLGCLSLIA